VRSSARNRFAARAAIILLLAAGGCYRGNARPVVIAEAARQPGWVMVRDVRLIRQRTAHDCGAAALAMVLEHWGIPDASPEIARTLPTGPGKGLEAGNLRRFARERGLKAFLVSAGPADLLNELQANRPVLVGLVQRYSGNQGYSHYEVVVGFNQLDHRVLLLDPGHGEREDDLKSFDEEWRPSGRLALVVAPS
jgi:ABC-type bacteriocin/lantibiotic exporter with double-glycine peptidase domain